MSLAGWPSQKHGLSKQQSLLKLSHESEPCKGHLGRDVSHWWYEAGLGRERTERNQGGSHPRQGSDGFILDREKAWGKSSARFCFCAMKEKPFPSVVVFVFYSFISP